MPGEDVKTLLTQIAIERTVEEYIGGGNLDTRTVQIGEVKEEDIPTAISVRISYVGTYIVRSIIFQGTDRILCDLQI